MAVISRIEFQISGVVGSVGENLNFFLVQWDLMVKQILVTKPKKIKLYSVRASKCFLNEKNLIHGQVMETISRFSPRFLKHSLAGCPNGASLWMPYITLSVN